MPEARNQNLDRWFAAVEPRRSVRTYDGSALEPPVLESISEVCRTFRPFPDARVELVDSPHDGVFRGIVGGYGRISGAPHMLLVIGRTDSPTAQQHAGYTGEGLVLEAAASGLATCWIGGLFSRDKANRLVALGPGERILAVSPLGRAAAALGATDTLLRALAHSKSRKPLGSIVIGDLELWPEWAAAAVRCARLAPSAMNRQPWRFAFRDGALAVLRDSTMETPKVTKALDCGIAMLHAELGAHSRGVHGSWCDADGVGLDVAVFEPENPA